MENRRGSLILDPIMGCPEGMKDSSEGCYGSCYAASYSRRYGYDFSKARLRFFENFAHNKATINGINRSSTPFVRMGGSGDPSHDWDHSIDIIKTLIAPAFDDGSYQCGLWGQSLGCRKEIVIITKHWNLLTEQQLAYLSGVNVCVNTSISALDKPDLLERRLRQFRRLKVYCRSVLRIVSCDFNLDNPVGHELENKQRFLFTHKPVIDTVFRPSRGNRFVSDGIINVQKGLFLGKQCDVSKRDKEAYLGHCKGCPELCGVNL
jgi:hypothetical protein